MDAKEEDHRDIDQGPDYYIEKLNMMYSKFDKTFKEYFGWTYEDYKQEMTIHYLEIRPKFREGKNARFETYMIGCLKNKFIDIARKTKRLKRAAFVCCENGGDMENLNKQNLMVQNKIDQLEAYNDNFVEALERKQDNVENLTILTGKDKEVYTLLVSANASIKEISEFMNMSITEVETKLDKIVTKLRKYHGIK